VGISGGETILEMVSALPVRKRPGASFYALALIGRGMMFRSSHVGPETNTTLAWARSGRKTGQLHYCTVLSYRADKTAHRQACESVCSQAEDFLYPHVERFLRNLGGIDVAIASLGLINPRSVIRDGEFDKLSMTGLIEMIGITEEALHKEGAIGDLSYTLFDEKGESREHWRFFLTAGFPDGLSFYRKMVNEKKPVIVIAGPHKLDVLRVGLNGNLFNVVITDEHTAMALVGQ
jgi:DNA-binding transcriptional regulator LsrR (DeoR family)